MHYRLQLTAPALAALAVTAMLSLPSTAAAGPGPRLEIGSPRVAAKAAPLTLTVQASRKADLTLRVNGERVKDAFQFAGRRIQVAHLSSSDGLTPGANRLRVHGETPDGTATRKRTVRVPRRALLADAGPDRGMIAGAPLRVGATPSGPGAAPGVRHHWRIVRAPDAANPTLAHRRGAQPVIDTSTPGTYALRLKARRKGHRGASYDKVTISVNPPDPPIGAPIDTLASDGAIRIAGSSYGASADESRLAYAVMERTTRTVVASGTVSGDASGISDLSALADKYSSGDNYLRYLMVVSGRRSPARTGSDAAAPFFSLLKNLGVPLLQNEPSLALQTGRPFSVIGVPGGPPGAATYRIPGRSTVNPSGAIIGYLQKNEAITADGTPLYDYASSERPDFDTRASGSTDTKNVMTVGDARYEASLADTGVAGAKAGLHVVVLEGQTLKPLQNALLVTNAANPSGDRQLQEQAGQKLRAWFSQYDDPMFLIQTVGKPKAAGPEWDRIANQFTLMGANRQLVNALDGTTEYAVVGSEDSDQAPAEASTAFDHPPYTTARLVGTLTHTRNYTFEPTATSTPNAENPAGGPNIQLTRIAFQPSQPWPPLAEGSPRNEVDAAEHYICVKVGFCREADSCPDLRSCYWQRYSANWASKEALVGGYPGPGHGFSEATFNAVKDQLVTEMAAVANVQKYMHDLQEPFQQSAQEAYVDLQAIGQKVYDAVQPPPKDTRTSFALGLVSKILLLGTFAPPPTSRVASGLSAGFGIAAYLSERDGTPILGSEIKAKTTELAGQLLNRYNLARHALASLGPILVSDHGKLMAANEHINTNWHLPFDLIAASESLRTASNQWFYESLIPVAYPYLIRGDAANARSMDCRDPNHAGWPNQPDDAQMTNTTVGYDANGNPIKNVFFFARGMWGAASPPSGLADPIFRSRNRGGLGVERLSFFTPSVFGNQIAHAFNRERPACLVGYLPKWP